MNLSSPLDGILDPNLNRVLHRLAILGDGETGRRIHELSAVASLRTTQRILASLTEIGLVHVESVGRAHRYVLNRDHLLWGPLEALYGALAQLERLIADRFAEAAPGNLIALYGSTVRGTAGRDSDIDLAVVWDTDLDADQQFATLDSIGTVVNTATGNRAEFVDVTPTQLASMAASHDPLTESWLSESRTLVGEPDLAARVRAGSR